jgi:chloride channel 3/4/5
MLHRHRRYTLSFQPAHTSISRLHPAGEVCHEWQSWSQYLHVRSIIGQSLLQAFVYIALGVGFAGVAAVLVVHYAPHAFHTGIPEVIAILDGYVLDAFLGPWTLLIKALGVAMAVASGLSLGKEGPLVHIACCAASLFARLFPELRGNEGMQFLATRPLMILTAHPARKRQLLAAAAAAGVSVAFGSPLGGVLFGLEELGRFADESGTMWRAFVTSALAAVALQYVDPFGTARLVLFQATAASDAWRGFELVPWAILGVIGVRRAGCGRGCDADGNGRRGCWARPSSS